MRGGFSEAVNADAIRVCRQRIKLKGIALAVEKISSAQRYESKASGSLVALSVHRVWRIPVSGHFAGERSQGSRSGQGALESTLQLTERQFMRREHSVKRSRARSGSHAVVAHNYAFKRTAGTGHDVS